ncbi:probable serine/threonine-protein kinase DDB_G0278509 [Anastrepha obliqua]|uniref:probable serine/threonine-protein kinase DDB_G0278509 n=1 Tax=Anastrepha obliqua TaxID=95512 RepID=UPI00240A08A6|nr:probable serine/threonine-protein kinase DDB_G0278509 [Anastrepha obliqua]XP_054731168.1 probable serine/threonine-protein kinase DDB_G0278509 [Anastrepha obliqua]XP_054731169.1 probable serine/threonine-protein kinase DDB_G0278509 [Anastrepha obliqua]XP_054731170.1 probable serine/threonine-protein kinase DDB_G0278509 [Anastrepha obliqua]XP_054731171.1 probable serine/threonine-protein kinase DDB_G0278509 [Anastrepha obliqua]XP_054731172.1 probable serine/threonine-protein kinase DDB_G0278
MINSANTVDFKVMNHGNVLLQSEMVPLEKCKLVHTAKIPQSGGERFTTSYAIQTSLVDPYPYTAEKKHGADFQSAQTKEIHMQPQRVHVQHLQTHPNLQNNRWSSHTFYNLSKGTDRATPNVCTTKTNHNNNLISKESAFSLSSNSNNNNNNNTNINNNISIPNTFKNDESSKDLQIVGNGPIRPIREVDAHRELSDRRMTSVYRTDYQENAFLRIEDVHNYAKLDRYSYSNESSNSSMHEEENEDEDEELDEDLDDNNDDAATNYERYLRNSKQIAARKGKSVEEAQLNMGNMRVTRMETEETEHNVDVETVYTVQNDAGVAVPSTPDHHARRPMNAFLIFCKRHRAIVKERYKSLENRAITKILGDWWASLDASDKKCFTNLAQQNKDAFFNANPNFKWYKLPAPPLRTLNTRPGNNERLVDQDDDIKSLMAVQNSGGMLPKYTTKSNNSFFKLADEAQMGELSALINGEGNNANTSMNQSALQQALGETSQFLNAYMPPNCEADGGQASKNRLLSENSFSSNGSEDDVLPKKSSRACKGKIYQELINSGQISAVSKKVKAPKSQSHAIGFTHQTVTPSHSCNQISLEGSNNIASICATLPISKNNVKIPETFAGECSHTNSDLLSFDLEEKIKELPALSLDLYLQRKRNTKKKKKFTSKKRHSNSAASSKNLGVVNVTSTALTATTNKMREAQPHPAVGSQKRKARKESITRRDITAIENEIASVIPLAKSFSTINGCYYFNESAGSAIPKSLLLGRMPNSTVAAVADNQRTNASFANLSNDNISSTSDLFILAEVAANRTELTN